MQSLSTAEKTWARMLARARMTGTSIAAVASMWLPQDAESAYRVQHEVVSLRGETIRGWKVGSKTPTGAIQAAPLPAGDLHATGAVLRRDQFQIAGLELEIGFRLGDDVPMHDGPYDQAELLQAIGSTVATIEVVSTRFSNWPDVDKLAQLADLQNHGALVVSDEIPFNGDFPFLAPTVKFEINGRSMTTARASNPAGDPRRLLPWLAGHCARMGTPLRRGDIITTGSYTGQFFVDKPGTVVGEIKGLLPVIMYFE